MATKEIEVDLYEFGTPELTQELINRIKYGVKYEDSFRINELKDELRKLYSKLELPVSNEFDNKSLETQLKLEHIAKVIGKYSISEIEKLLPE